MEIINLRTRTQAQACIRTHTTDVPPLNTAVFFYYSSKNSATYNFLRYFILIVLISCSEPYDVFALVCISVCVCAQMLVFASILHSMQKSERRKNRTEQSGKERKPSQYWFVVMCNGAIVQYK